MGIATNTSINTNAQRPTDSKMVVGANQEYATRSAIPSIYRYYGMRVYDLNNNIEYEMVTYNSQDTTLEIATIGNTETTYAWKNVSFGVEPFIYRSNGVWQNPSGVTTINGLSSGETLTFSAITFGHIKQITWTITKNGSTMTSSNKETFTYQLPSIGTYIVSVTATDYFGNTFTAKNITLYNVSTIGVTTITQFTVNPTVGLQQLTNRTYSFYTLLSEDLAEDNIESFVISYGVNNITLISNGESENGVSHSGNEITVDGAEFSEFDEEYLSATTIFTATLTRTNGQVATASATYTSIPLININENASVTYCNYDDGTITARVTLSSAYDNNSSVSGILKIGTTTIGTFAVPSDNMTFDYTGSYTLDTGTNVLTAYLTQTCNGETYEDTVIFNVVVSETTYTVTINVKDNLEIPEAIENASVVIIKGGVTVYNNQTNISGVINTYLSNGYYAVSITKDYYNSVSLFFTISDSNETINVTLSPNVELYSLSATTPVPGDTMTVNYVLLPNNKYEDECSIQYIVRNIEEEIVSNTTKLLSTLPDAYNQLDIDSGWSNGHTIEIILISTYDGDNVTGTITKTIGTMPIFYGVLSSISSPTSRTITNVIANELADIGDVGFNTELSYSGSGNLNVYFSDNITTVGYGWIAIPNNYEFLHCADKDEPTQSIDISNNFYSTGIVIGSTNYVVYMEMGTIPSSPFFGTLSPTNNWIFKS